MRRAILAGLLALCFGTSVPAVDPPPETDSPEHLLLIFAGQSHLEAKKHLTPTKNLDERC